MYSLEEGRTAPTMGIGCRLAKSIMMRCLRGTQLKQARSVINRE